MDLFCFFFVLICCYIKKVLNLQTDYVLKCMYANSI